MPNGIYPVPTNRRIRAETARRSRGSRPGVGLRLRTWWRRDRLDEQLAQGIDPRKSAELVLRGEQLSNRAERARLAKALDGVVQEAGEPPAFLRLLARRAEVRASADELRALAHRLRDDLPVDPRGVAMTALLLSDGESPLFSRWASVPLREAVRSARLALDESRSASRPAFPTAA